MPSAAARRPGWTLGQEPGQRLGQGADQGGVLLVGDPRPGKDAQRRAHRGPFGFVRMLGVLLVLSPPGYERESALELVEEPAAPAVPGFRMASGIDGLQRRLFGRVKRGQVVLFV